MIQLPKEADTTLRYINHPSFFRIVLQFTKNCYICYFIWFTQQCFEVNRDCIPHFIRKIPEAQRSWDLLLVGGSWTWIHYSHTHSSFLSITPSWIIHMKHNIVLAPEETRPHLEYGVQLCKLCETYQHDECLNATPYGDRSTSLGIIAWRIEF